MHKHIKCEKKRKNIFKPQPHQKHVLPYLIKSKHRGLMLYHALGSGKSCTSILFADTQILETEQVYVFSPASIRKSFIDEYCKVCGKDPKTLEENFIFFSYNYSGIIKLLPENLDNSLIIIDEIHNVINGKRNNSFTLTQIYDLVNTSVNSKILLLSGTPIKKIYDVPLLINLLKPNTFKIDYIDDEFNEELFDELLMKKDIEIQGTPQFLKVPKSDKSFLKYFKGIISYVSGADPTFYPKRKDKPIQKVYMTEGQTMNFYNAIEWEVNRQKPVKALRKKNPKKYALEMGYWHVANKRLLSRAASNFLYPPKVTIGKETYHLNVKCAMLKQVKKGSFAKCKEEEELKTLPDKLLGEGGWLHPSIFEPKKLSGYYSPKMYKLMENIGNNFDGKHMIYSALKTRSGVYLMQSLLKMCGLSTLVYSGDLPSDEKRAEVLNLFNNKNNLNGEKYKVILLTEAGGQGLTLKAVKNVHILESDKNESTIQQVIGRAIRYKSHDDLPPDERYCNVWRYFSIPYEKVKKQAEEKIIKQLEIEEEDPILKEVWSIDGVDANLFKLGVKKEKQKEVFLKLMQQSTI